MSWIVYLLSVGIHPDACLQGTWSVKHHVSLMTITCSTNVSVTAYLLPSDGSYEISVWCNDAVSLRKFGELLPNSLGG